MAGAPAAGSTERDADYINTLMQIVGSSVMDSAKSVRLTDLLSGEGSRALAPDTRTQVVACFIGEGRWNVDAQKFDGAPDWEHVRARLLRVSELVEARRGRKPCAGGFDESMVKERRSAGERNHDHLTCLIDQVSRGDLTLPDAARRLLDTLRSIQSLDKACAVLPWLASLPRNSNTDLLQELVKVGGLTAVAKWIGDEAWAPPSGAAIPLYINFLAAVMQVCSLVRSAALCSLFPLVLRLCLHACILLRLSAGLLTSSRDNESLPFLPLCHLVLLPNPAAHAQN